MDIKWMIKTKKLVDNFFVTDHVLVLWHFEWSEKGFGNYHYFNSPQSFCMCQKFIKTFASKAAKNNESNQYLSAP